MIVHPSPSSGSALRQRMIGDMTVRGFTAKTQHDSIRYVKTFAAFLSRSHDRDQTQLRSARAEFDTVMVE